MQKGYTECRVTGRTSTRCLRSSKKVRAPGKERQEAFIIKPNRYIMPRGLYADSAFSCFADQRDLDIRALDIPVNAMATALKQFFGDLTEPLIPLSLTDDLVDAACVRDRTERLIALRTQLRRIPQCNWDVLKFLVKHLVK